MKTFIAPLLLAIVLQALPPAAHALPAVQRSAASTASPLIPLSPSGLARLLAWLGGPLN